MDYPSNSAADLFTKVEPEKGIENIVQFPLTRIFIVIVFLLPVFIFGIVLKSFLSSFLSLTLETYIFYFIDLLLIALAFLLYNVYTLVIERRKAKELSFEKSFTELGAGFLFSFFLIGLIVLSLAFAGYYKIGEFNSFGNVIFMFFNQLKVGFFEELLFRIIIFKLVEEYAGSWIAIIVQAVLFGFAHAANPNATIITSLSITLFFGLLFASGYIITRRMWFIFGFHWGWNFFQAGIFGMQNSGWKQPSLITPVIQGPALLTGGNWGLENSILTMVVLFLIGFILMKFVIKKGRLVKPQWNR